MESTEGQALRASGGGLPGALQERLELLLDAWRKAEGQGVLGHVGQALVLERMLQLGPEAAPALAQVASRRPGQGGSLVRRLCLRWGSPDLHACVLSQAQSFEASYTLGETGQELVHALAVVPDAASFAAAFGLLATYQVPQDAVLLEACRPFHGVVGPVLQENLGSSDAHRRRLAAHLTQLLGTRLGTSMRHPATGRQVADPDPSVTAPARGGASFDAPADFAVESDGLQGREQIPIDERPELQPSAAGTQADGSEGSALDRPAEDEADEDAGTPTGRFSFMRSKRPR